MHIKLVMICALFISMIISIYVVFHPQLKESKLFIDRPPTQSILNFLTNGFAIFTAPLLFFIIIFSYLLEFWKYYRSNLILKTRQMQLYLLLYLPEASP